MRLIGWLALPTGAYEYSSRCVGGTDRLSRPGMRKGFRAGRERGGGLARRDCSTHTSAPKPRPGAVRTNERADSLGARLGSVTFSARSSSACSGPEVGSGDACSPRGLRGDRVPQREFSRVAFLLALGVSVLLALLPGRSPAASTPMLGAPGMGLDRRIAVARTLGVRYVRPNDLRLPGWRGSDPEVLAFSRAGFQTVLDCAQRPRPGGALPGRTCWAAGASASPFRPPGLPAHPGRDPGRAPPCAAGR